MATITFHGNQAQTNGELPQIGSSAPDFKLVSKDLSNVTLSEYVGKMKLLNIVPSLDTGVCATSTKRFNDFAKQRDDVTVLVISADLPFAQSRFCVDEDVENVIALSMMRSRNFAKDYGVLIEDGPLAGITARAVLVLDAENRVVYTQLVAEIAQEPDYDAAIAAVG